LEKCEDFLVGVDKDEKKKTGSLKTKVDKNKKITTKSADEIMKAAYIYRSTTDAEQIKIANTFFTDYSDFCKASSGSADEYDDLAKLEYNGASLIRGLSKVDLNESKLELNKVSKIDLILFVR
jgi:hypothetical protein